MTDITMFVSFSFRITFLLAIFRRAIGVAGDPFADAPYNPSYVWVSSRETPSVAYVLSPGSSVSAIRQLQSLDLSVAFDASAPPLQDLANPAPFLEGEDNDNAVIPVTDEDGLPILYTGDCNSQTSTVWKLAPGMRDDPAGKEEWLELNAYKGEEDTSLGGPNFLAAAVTFSQFSKDSPSDIFLLGGMCPTNSGTGSSWVSAADYSRDMRLLTPDGSSNDSQYSPSTVELRSPPVPEAGFSMTPLLPAQTNTSAGRQLTQQSFVLIGGHTQHAFINTSQVAVFSLPETSWSYLPVTQPISGSRLGRRQANGVEPRSGHTAVLSPDGSKIIVLGGWVGDTTVPAEPQLAVLRLGEGYGGSLAWTWDVPQESPHGLQTDTGIFGHGAAMLPGGVMLIAGGFEIPVESPATAEAPKPNKQFYLFDTTSESWVTSYALPSQSANDPNENSGPLSSPAEKAGLGVGLGVGVPALSAVALALFCYQTRHSRQRRKLRKQEPRKLALGVERSHSHDRESHSYQPVMQATDEHPPFEGRSDGLDRSGSHGASGTAQAERTGLLVESPSAAWSPLNSGIPRDRRPATPRRGGSRGINNIHPIDEGDEYEEIPQDEAEPYDDYRYSKGSSVGFDPFVEPPSPVKASLAPPMLPEFPLLNERDGSGCNWLDEISPAVTHGGLHGLSGRRSTSPDKSSRTQSSLSDGSGSGTSVSSNKNNPFSLNPMVVSQLSTCHSKKGPSTSDTSSSIHNAKYNHELSRRHTPPPLAHQKRKSDVDNVSAGAYAFDDLPDAQGSPSKYKPKRNSGSLMGQGPAWLTQPESTIKQPNGPKSKALEWAGNVRRAFGSVRKSDIAAQPQAVTHVLTGSNHHEIRNQQQRSSSTSPTKSLHNAQDARDPYDWDGPSLLYGAPQRAVSTNSSMLKRKQGAKDWDVAKRRSAESSALLRNSAQTECLSYVGDNSGSGPASRSTDSPDFTGDGYDEENDDEDWDVEAAAEGRVVQVTFTVPREKLRVVNGEVGDGSDDDNDSVAR